MRNSKSKVRCEKRKLPKCEDLLRLYSPMQSRYADLLQADNLVKSFQCNVPLESCAAGDGFTTDFVVTKTDDTVMVRECVYRKHLKANDDQTTYGFLPLLGRERRDGLGTGSRPRWIRRDKHRR